MFGVFRVKNHDFTQKNHIFSNFVGGARRVRPPPLDPPLIIYKALHRKLKDRVKGIPPKSVDEIVSHSLSGAQRYLQLASVSPGLITLMQ